MLDWIITLLTNKQLFTTVILSLYVCNCLFQFLVTRDYAFGGYWMSAAMITVFAMHMSQR